LACIGQHWFRFFGQALKLDFSKSLFQSQDALKINSERMDLSVTFSEEISSYRSKQFKLIWVGLSYFAQNNFTEAISNLKFAWESNRDMAGMF